MLHITEPRNTDKNRIGPMKTLYQSALIIEDDPDLRTLLSNILSREIASVLSSDNLKNAQELVNDNKPDFIILDNNLPDGQGINYIKTFRALCPRASIFLISALPNLKEEASKYGADGYIEKPLRIADIQSLLHKQ